MWVAVDRRGTKYVCDELYIKCQNGVEELSQLIKNKNEKYRVVRKMADPWIFSEDELTQRKLSDDFSKYGLDYLPATKARSSADKKIENALTYNQLPTGEFIKHPDVFIFNTCHRTIFEMEH